MDLIDEEYEVERITDKKVTKRRRRSDNRIEKQLHYRVKWKGYDEHTWEPVSNLSKSTEEIELFEDRLRAERSSTHIASNILTPSTFITSLRSMSSTTKHNTATSAFSLDLQSVDGAKHTMLISESAIRSIVTAYDDLKSPKANAQVIQRTRRTNFLLCVHQIVFFPP